MTKQNGHFKNTMSDARFWVTLVLSILATQGGTALVVPSFTSNAAEASTGRLREKTLIAYIETKTVVNQHADALVDLQKENFRLQILIENLSLKMANMVHKKPKKTVIKIKKQPSIRAVARLPNNTSLRE